MALRIREMTAEEQKAIERLAHSRTAAAQEVERARIVWYSGQGLRVPAIAQQLGVSGKGVRLWLKRFNTAGVAGLQDIPRMGRPAPYTPEQTSTVVTISLTPPRDLGLPFACWTLDRWEAYLHAVAGMPIKRSRIDDVLLAEGLRWQPQEGWFGEHGAADFAEKRGASRGCTPNHPPGVR
ncbi:MAG: helix-turn-helix domain-containing protein [Chloroflexi bacterium]|nr:helix-turn-helix domain-containing protein [Chloroflexota bacterium]